LVEHWQEQQHDIAGRVERSRVTAASGIQFLNGKPSVASLAGYVHQMTTLANI
jgi:hypothetical protein